MSDNKGFLLTKPEWAHYGVILLGVTQSVVGWYCLGPNPWLVCYVAFAVGMYAGQCLNQELLLTSRERWNARVASAYFAVLWPLFLAVLPFVLFMEIKEARERKGTR